MCIPSLEEGCGSTAVSANEPGSHLWGMEVVVHVLKVQDGNRQGLAGMGNMWL